MAQRERTTRAPLTAIEHCRALTRHHSKTFYLGSRFFPHEQRLAVWAVYAACRDGDDAVDEGPPEGAADRLDAWWNRVERAYQGRPTDDCVSEALAWAVERYAIPQGAFHELLLGLRMDLDGHEYRDARDLDLYCRRVAGVVGFMIAPICGYDGGQGTLERALRLGQAMQLTNILRDVGEDAARGRLYLPRDVMDRFGVTRADVMDARLSPQYEALLRHLCAQARDWYREGSAGIPRLHGRGRVAVATAARAYEGILTSLEENGWDNFTRRASVSGTRKLLMIPGVLWQLRGA
nr:phytoene/squalene synthase family protein [Deinococcus pimensis]